MTTLMLAATRGGLPAPFGVEFRVGFDGAPPAIVTPPIAIPPATSSLEVMAVPSSGDVWPVSATYGVQADGSLVANDPTPAFAPPIPVGDLVTLVALLSRLRDATASAVTGLQAVVSDPLVASAMADGQSRAASVPRGWVQPDGSIQPPADYQSPGLDRISTLCMPPYDGAGPRTALRFVRPDSNTRVLEIIGDPVPRLIGVTWPNDLLAGGARPLPFLLYFHHGIGQEEPRGYWKGPAGAYPFGYDAATYGLWRYLQYSTDPAVDNHGEKGIAFQVEAAGRSLVSIVPLNRLGAEAGQAVEASWIRDLLRDVQDFIHAWHGLIVLAPVLDRLAVAGFSSSNLFAAQLVQSALANGAFAEDVLQEVYLFDPPADIQAMCISAAGSFVHGTKSEKRVRIYAQTLPTGLDALMSPQAVPSPNVRSDSSGRRTFIQMSLPAWTSFLLGRGGSTDMHQLIPALSLVDALRRSEFPRRQLREAGWLWCQRCQALFDSSGDGACAAGGSHDGSASGPYEVRLEEGDLACQPGWRWCNRCQCLFFAVRPAPGACAAGGDHDGGIGPEYEVAMSAGTALEQAGWRWCSRCGALCFSGAGAGACPAGGGHDLSASGEYAVTMG